MSVAWEAQAIASAMPTAYPVLSERRQGSLSESAAQWMSVPCMLLDTGGADPEGQELTTMALALMEKATAISAPMAVVVAIVAFGLGQPVLGATFLMLGVIGAVGLVVLARMRAPGGPRGSCNRDGTSLDRWGLPQLRLRR